VRIAVLLNAFPALSETFVLSQITGLLDLGHDVRIFARTRRGEDEAQSDYWKYDLRSRTVYRKGPFLPRSGATRWKRMARTWLRQPGALRWTLARHALAARRDPSLPDLRQAFSSLPYLKLQEFDLIHAQYGNLGVRAATADAVRPLRPKLVVSFRGLDASALPFRNPGHYDRLFQRGDLFLAVSRDLAGQLVSLGCPAEKIVVHHSGIHLERFPFAPRRPPKRGPVELLSVGRHVEKKGLDVAIRAVALLARRCPGIRYRIAGEGRMRPQLEALIRELDVGERVQLLGARRHEDVIELMARSHVLLAPSRTGSDRNREGIPNAIMEAFATGMPVVASRHGGIPEIVEEGVSGLLAEEGDPEALCQRIAEMLAHPERWAEMGAAGRARVEREFEIGALNARLEALYRGLVDAPPRLAAGATSRRLGSSP
jgi:colanic acid/amylovoran biosynthesis glycosyltransferase